MKFKLAPLALSSIAVLMSATAFAGGADIVPLTPLVNYNKGLSVGLLGGVGVGVSPLEANYQYITAAPLTNNTLFDNSVANIIGSTGLQANYMWAITNRYSIGIETDFLYNFGNLTEDWTVPDTVAPGDVVLNLQNKIRYKDQYNLTLLEKYALNQKFTLLFNAGFTAIYVQNSMNLSYANSGAIVTNPSTRKSSTYLFGGIIGTGIDLSTTSHSSLGLRAIVSIYAPGNLKTLNTIGELPNNTSDSLRNRKIGLILPSIYLTYSYRF